MPKALDTQGFSGLREEAVRSEGRPSRTSVLQALNDYWHLRNSTHFGGCCFFARRAAFCHARAVVSASERASGGISACKAAAARCARCALPVVLLSSPSAKIYFYQKETAFAVSFLLNGSQLLTVVSAASQPLSVAANRDTSSKQARFICHRQRFACFLQALTSAAQSPATAMVAGLSLFFVFSDLWLFEHFYIWRTTSVMTSQNTAFSPVII